MIKDLFFKEKDNFTWIDITAPEKGELEDIAQKFNIHPFFIYDCLQPAHLPKLESIEDVHLLIVRFFNEEIPYSSDTLGDVTNKLAIFYNDDFIVTIHRTPLKFLDVIAEKCIHVKKKESIEIIIDIVKATLETFVQPAAQLFKDLDYYESKIFLKAKIPPVLRGLYFLRRKGEIIKRILGITRGVVEKFEISKNRAFLKQELIDTFNSLDHNYESILYAGNNLLNIYLSLSSQRTNENLRVLTVFSVFFMPLTFIVGVYGMNFKFMPEIDEPYAYPILWLIMILISTGIFIWFKRKKII